MKKEFAYRQTAPLALFGIAAISIAAGSAGAAKKAPPPTTATFQALYAQMDAAASHKDVRRFMSFFTRNCSFIDKHGKHYSYNQVGTRLSRMMPAVKQSQDITTVQSVDAEPGGVTVLTSSTSMLVGRDRKKHTETLQTQETSRDFWVKSGNTWRITSTQVLTEQDSVNGRVKKS